MAANWDGKLMIHTETTERVADLTLGQEKGQKDKKQSDKRTIVAKALHGQRYPMPLS